MGPQPANAYRGGRLWLRYRRWTPLVTLQEVYSYRNLTTGFGIRWPSVPLPCNRPNGTTRSTTERCWQSLRRSRTGDTSWKDSPKHLRSLPITPTSNTGAPLRTSADVSVASPSISPASTSSSPTAHYPQHFDDDLEFSPHVPVPLDPERGVATVPERPRRTPRSPYGMLDTGSGYFSNSPYESESESRRREACMSAATSQDSHENSLSTASHSSSGLGEKVEMGRQRSTSMDSRDPVVFPIPLVKPRLSRPTSFADLRNRASMIISGSRSSSSSSSSLHIPLSDKRDAPPPPQVVVHDVDTSVIEDTRGRRKSIAMRVLDVFRPKSKIRSHSLSIEVTKTTAVTKIEQASFQMISQHLTSPIPHTLLLISVRHLSAFTVNTYTIILE
ncbi:hypothetical protein NMY22_g19421 [Coprinellus aureogranulatus]|nr:hypothetical protein NMY22_g19421 [Coprinellus aureogranulatus]